METNKNPETGFTIDKILLVESSFRRISNMAFDEKNVENTFDINVDVSVNDSTIIVAETVSLNQKFHGTEQFDIKVKMVGIFMVVGKTSITDLDEFGKVNGAAIIFPYIREHITNCFVKAGIGGVFLPPVNFTGK